MNYPADLIILAGQSDAVGNGGETAYRLKHMYDMYILYAIIPQLIVGRNDIFLDKRGSVVEVLLKKESYVVCAG